MHLGLKKIQNGVYEGRKVFDIEEFKSIEEDGHLFISGYVNTKNKEDAYGDIPTNFNGNPVYDAARYKKNPVLLVDHENSSGNIAGKSVFFEETDKGWFNKFQLMKDPKNLLVAHAIQAVKEGLLKAFSIGGRWLFEDSQNPKHLTKAIIHEVSLVAIGADPRALVSSTGKSLAETSSETSKASTVAFVEHLISEYRKTGDEKILDLVNKIRGMK